MSEYSTITFRIEHGVGVITLNRPKTRNSLNTAMRAELKHVFENAKLAGARALILTGEGDSFCSGQDLTGDLRQEAPDLTRPLREEYMPMLAAMLACPLPIIAAVKGAAAGAGASLALAADVVIAAQSARFVVAFARIGLVPDVGLTWVLPRLIGLQRATALALTAEPVAGAQAAEWGMAMRCVEDDALMTEASALAARFAEGPSLAYALTKNLMREGLARDLTAQLEAEAEAQGEAGRSRDFAEGVAAFMQKRPPEFKGR